MIRIGKTTDLLRAKPITLQLRDHGMDQVMVAVAGPLTKCARSLGVSLDRMQLETLCEDLIDTYSHDSLEDIMEALKKGRRGEYGFGMNKRGFLNMPVIRAWMQRHLEDKAAAREEELRKTKPENKEPLSDQEDFYDEYRKRMNDPKPKKNNAKENEYQRWRLERLKKVRSEREVRRSYAHQIIEITSAGMHISVADIMGLSRKIKIVTARHTAMYLVRKYLRLSTIEIAILFNRYNHSTVVNALHNVESWKRSENAYKTQLEALKRSIKQQYYNQ